MEIDWINVKDQLPDIGKEVLVWSDRYGRTFGTFCDKNKFGTIWRYHGDPIATFNAPSHWAPLLERPKP